MIALGRAGIRLPIILGTAALLSGCLAPEEFECGDVVCRPFAFVGGCAKLLCSIALLPCALLAYCRHRCCLDLPAWELDGPCPACPAACPGCEVKPCSVRAPARRAPRRRRVT